MKEHKFKQYFAAGIVILLILFLTYTVYVFVNGFFGALLLYVTLLPLYNFMTKRKFSKGVSAGIVIFIALFVIVVPLVTVLGIVGNEIVNIIQNPVLIEKGGDVIIKTIAKISPSMSEGVLIGYLENLTSSINPIFFNIGASAGRFTVNLFIAFFLLYFMLVEGPFFEKVKHMIPFSRKSSREIIKKIKDISYSTVVVGGIIALIQGGLLTISFLIFGISGAFLWGFITAIFSLLPVFGASIVWLPAAIIQFIQGDYWAAGGVFVFGLFLSNIDNIIRPLLGEKLAKIHPVTTLIGVFIGVYLFGLIGIFAGPLFLAFSLFIIRMFKEEYVR